MVPILLMCVLPANPIIPGEGVPIIVMSVLGFTTGYMGSTPMCAASSQVALEEREMAGGLCGDYYTVIIKYNNIM